MQDQNRRDTKQSLRMVSSKVVLKHEKSIPILTLELCLSILSLYSLFITSYFLPLLYSRFHYILIALIMMSIYLIYLIGFYTIQQFQTTSYLEGMEAANSRTREENKKKEFLAAYIQRPAYQTQVAKATRNKKLPGEVVINIIGGDEAEGNKDRDSATVIAEARKKEDDPTKNMSNPEKWWYLLKKGI